MDWAIDYMKKKQSDNKILVAINNVRLYQKLLLPYKLVEIQGGRKTMSYNNINIKSQIEWEFEIPKVKKSCESIRKEWQQFINQLAQQVISMLQGFKDKCQMKYYISIIEEYLKVSGNMIY